MGDSFDREFDGKNRLGNQVVRAHQNTFGANDLIAKPIFPIELAVKAVAHLIRRKLASEAAVAA